MAALDFPASPSNGQTYTGPGGVVWIWDGSKWVTQGIGGGFYLPIAGGQMTGPLGAISGGPPTASINFGGTANTGLYGNANLVGILSGGQARFTVDNTAVFSTLPINLPGAPTAPLHAATKAYVDTGAAAAVVPAQNNVGRNLIHNPLFNIAQRGVGPFTANGVHTADRWIMVVSGGTHSLTIAAVSDADRANIGDEAASSNISAVVVGGAGASDETFIEQRLEGVRRTAGKTVTLSFWAKSSVAAQKIGSFCYQSFGTGGSPSGIVLVTGQNVTISTTYARYSMTFTLPSVAGKTFGTNGNDFLDFRLAFSAGASIGANYGGLGVQSGTFQIWGVQLEIGSTMTPLEKPDPADDLARCQRFYEVITILPDYTNALSGATAIYRSYQMAVIKRVSPTMTYAGLQYYSAGNNAAFTPVSVPSNQGMVGIIATGLTNAQGISSGTLMASADL